MVSNISKQVKYSVNELPTTGNSMSTMIKTKFKNVFDKNKGLMVFNEISKILQGESANFNNLSIPNYSSDILTNFKYYAPITSVDVERSFPSYILTFSHPCTSSSSFYRNKHGTHFDNLFSPG